MIFRSQFLHSCHFTGYLHCHFTGYLISKKSSVFPLLSHSCCRLWKKLRAGRNRTTWQPKHFSSFFCLRLWCGVTQPIEEKENRRTSGCKQQQLGSKKLRENSRDRRRNPQVFAVDSIDNWKKSQFFLLLLPTHTMSVHAILHVHLGTGHDSEASKKPSL